MAVLFALAPGALRSQAGVLWGMSSMEKKIDKRSITLPKPDRAGKIPFERALAGRRSVRSYSREPLTRAELSQLLWAAQGITSKDGGRTAPSAGALYPLELYVLAGRVRELPQGVYKYRPAKHDLIRISDEDLRAAVAAAALDQPSVKNGSVVILIAAVYARVTGKYGESGVMYTHMEVGLAAQNIYLQAETLGLGTVMIGAFYEDKVAALLELPQRETPLALMPVGRKR
jgi:SagB-type dehydrogenase family enzyme